MTTNITVSQPTAQPEKSLQSGAVTVSRRSLTVDEAYEQREDSRSLASERTETREPKDADGAVSTDAPTWTNEEVKTLAALGNRAGAYWQVRRNLEQGLALVAQAEAGLAQITDKGQAVARKVEIDRAKDDLSQHVKALVAEEQAIRGEYHRLTQAQLGRQLARESAKLPADYDQSANRREMQRRGYAANEIANVTTARDAQLVDDARRWREHIAGRKPPKVPKPRSAQTRQEAPPDEPQGNDKNPLHRRLGRSARDQLRRTGQLDDALAVLRQKRIAERASAQQ